MQAFALHCFDNRFWETRKAFLMFTGLFRFDPVTVAGGAKGVASPDKEQDFDFMRQELDNSIHLHKIKRCMLFTHHDYGAYGGFKRFNDDVEEEFKFHQEEHHKSQKNIPAGRPDLKVETYFIDLTGVIKPS